LLEMAKSVFTDEYRLLIRELVAARKRAGLTQQHVADKLGRPQSYVAKVESGQRRLDVIEFVHLARAVDADAPRIVKQLISE